MPDIFRLAFEPQRKFRLYHSRNFFFQGDYAELAQFHHIATAERHIKVCHRRIMPEADHYIRKLDGIIWAADQQRRAKNPALHV